MFKNIITDKETNLNNIEKKTFKFVCNLGCLLMKIVLEKKDKKIFKFLKGDTRYNNLGFREATVHSIMGDIKYKRRLYKFTEGGISKYVFLLDEEMNINIEEKENSINSKESNK